MEGGTAESAEDEALDAVATIMVSKSTHITLILQPFVQVFTDAQLQQVHNNERAITQREKEINEIVKSLLGVADIFQELQTMVIDQGTVLDRIDYNIEQTNVHMEAAHKELQTVSGRRTYDPGVIRGRILTQTLVLTHTLQKRAPNTKARPGQNYASFCL